MAPDQGEEMTTKSKTITLRPSEPPPSCQHYRIDNDTWRCVECGERMICQNQAAETVLSAPNLAACTNPACRAALDDGTYDETNPPAGCTNAHGVYIPDHSRQCEVVIDWNITYECERCKNKGNTIFDKYGVTWGCGCAHRGEPVSARGK